MHLTNYSINKNSSTYCPNEDAEEAKGHKWTLAALWQHFAECGLDSKPVWEKIKDMVIKTMISAEHVMWPLARTNLASQYNCYELFGFDFLLDADLKPWLIEVNISPSLHSSSSLDLDVKSPLATEVFNIARYHIPDKMSAKAQKTVMQKLGMESAAGDTASLCLDRRLYTRDISRADRAKQTRLMDVSAPSSDSIRRDRYLDAILERLMPDDVRSLIRAEDELAQLRHFQRIFPTSETHKYFRFFCVPRYHNLLYDAWETRYSECRSAGIDRLERLCLEGIHRKVPGGVAVSGGQGVAAAIGTDTSCNVSASSSSSSVTSLVMQALNATSATPKNCIDYSALKAPTGVATKSASPSAFLAEASPKTEAREETAKVFTMGKPSKKRTVLAKPLHLGCQSGGFGVTFNGCRSVSSSPEAMSLGDSGDSAKNSPRGGDLSMTTLDNESGNPTSLSNVVNNLPTTTNMADQANLNVIRTNVA